MKNYFLNQSLIFLLVLFLFESCNPKRTKYVSAKSGLIIREAPSSKSNAVGKLNFNEKIEIIDRSEGTETIGSISGNWVALASGDQNGFVFDAYLSKEPVSDPDSLLGKYRGTYGEDKSIYGEVALLSDGKSEFILNFCHDLAYIKGTWSLAGGIVNLQIDPKHKSCCPEIGTEGISLRVDSQNELYYIGNPIYACTLGEVGRSLFKVAL
ncbi:MULTISPECIES: SH3 domain-containing protein [Leptospira]|uniref:SH3 domain-containing protein n=1 Tax=Leptospira TaxID=171 RepID=UPI00214C82B1|nr:SH3 domain-containing protein [Leptospira sp. id769339]MCR1795892.1 SH3 domain-containing protein [Leptospira sp. id769339]